MWTIQAHWTARFQAWGFMRGFDGRRLLSSLILTYDLVNVTLLSFDL